MLPEKWGQLWFYFIQTKVLLVKAADGGGKPEGRGETVLVPQLCLPGGRTAWPSFSTGESRETTAASTGPCLQDGPQDPRKTPLVDSIFCRLYFPKVVATFDLMSPLMTEGEETPVTWA